MCEHCDEDAERVRPIVDAIIEAEAATLRAMPARHSQSQHVVRLANTILSTHQDSRGYMGQDDVQAMAMEYATVVLRLLSLLDIAGLSP